MLKEATKQTLELLKAAYSQPGQPVAKATFAQPGSPTTGLQQYNLEAPAKRLFPLLTPLRNQISRIGPSFGTAVNWKAVTAINSARVAPGIAEGKRGGIIAVTTAEYSAAFKALGLEADATFEAKYAMRTFVDVKSEATMDLLDSFFVVEEEILLGGNNSIALGVGPTPAGVASTGGTMTARTVTARVIALTHQGWMNANKTDLTVGVRAAAVRTNADASTDTVNYGAGTRSAEATGVVVAAGNDKKITWTWASVRGAFAYALYAGLTGAVKLIAIVNTTTYVQLADEAGGSQDTAAFTTDQSQDTLVFDGILAQVVKFGNNGYYRDLLAAKLTPDGKGGVVEIDTALKAFWDVSRLTPDTIYVAAEQFEDISKAILTGGTAPVLALQMEGSQGSLMGGIAVASYLNKFAPGGPAQLKIKIHPMMPPGTILFWSSSLPYKLNGVPSIFQLEERQSYYAIEWPLRTRRWEFGVYIDEVLKCYFPPSCGAIVNIASGLNPVT